MFEIYLFFGFCCLPAFTIKPQRETELWPKVSMVLAYTLAFVMLSTLSVLFTEAIADVAKGDPISKASLVQLFTFPAVIVLALSSRTLLGFSKSREPISPFSTKTMVAFVGSVVILAAMRLLRNTADPGTAMMAFRVYPPTHQIFLVLVLAPLLEEFYFRFFLPRVLIGVHHRSQAFTTLWVSVLFALIHYSPFETDLLTLLSRWSFILLGSILLFWQRFLTQRYWVCVGLHSTANLLTISL